MPDPKGKLVTPVGFDASVDPRSLEVDADDALRVALETAGKGLVGPHGHIGGVWQKQPLTLGYSGDVTEEKENLNTGAGWVTLQGSAVPAGEILLVNIIAARNVVSACAPIEIYIHVNGADIPIEVGANVAAWIWVLWSGQMVLSEGDYVWVGFGGCAAGDDVYLKYHAVRIDIDQ